jgi:hypothetical protein
MIELKKKENLTYTQNLGPGPFSPALCNSEFRVTSLISFWKLKARKIAFQLYISFLEVEVETRLQGYTVHTEHPVHLPTYFVLAHS